MQTSYALRYLLARGASLEFCDAKHFYEALMGFTTYNRMDAVQVRPPLTRLLCEIVGLYKLNHADKLDAFVRQLVSISGCTPDSNIISVLVQHGGEEVACGTEGAAAIQQAAGSGHVGTMAELVLHRGGIEPDLVAACMKRAAQHAHPAVVRLLLTTGTVSRSLVTKCVRRALKSLKPKQAADVIQALAEYAEQKGWLVVCIDA